MNPVPKLYQTVVEDVVNNVREYFLDEGVDDAVLQELKQLWQSKLKSSKAIDHTTPAHQQDKVFNMYNQVKGGQQQQQQQRFSQNGARLPSLPVQQRPQQVYTTQQGVQLSAPAQAAAMALPAGIAYQQNMLQPGTIIQGQDGTQYIVQPAAAAVQPANAAVGQYQVASTTLPNGILARQQLDGAADDSEEQPVASTSSAVLPTACSSNTSREQDLLDAACSLPLPRHRRPKRRTIPQEDGPNESSTDDDDYKDDDDDDDDEEKDEAEEEQEEDNPLNSGDDVSEEDPSELFDTENVVVCQYDKINRCKNRWKFHLKDGIMNLNGRDYVFQKSSGDAEW